MSAAATRSTQGAQVDPSGEGVVGDAVDGRALPDLDLRPAEQVLGAGQDDLPAVDRHEADREDVVGAGVEAGGLEVEREQPEVGRRRCAAPAAGVAR